MFFHLNKRIDATRFKCYHPKQSSDEPVDHKRFQNRDHKKRKCAYIRHHRNFYQKCPNDQNRKHILKHKCKDSSQVFRKVHSENIDGPNHICCNRSFFHAHLNSFFHIRDQQNRQHRRYDYICQHAFGIDSADTSAIFIQRFPEICRCDHNNRLHDNISIYTKLIGHTFY